MKRKHKEEAHEEHTDESWLIPYADILTLLLALFIVLFASSSIDQAKFNAMQEALYVAFNGEVSGNVSLGTRYVGAIPENFTVPRPISEQEDDGKPSEPTPEGNAEKGGALGHLYASLAEYVHANDLENTVAVEYNGEVIVFTLKNDIWFQSGSAFLTQEMQEKARMLTQLLEENQDDSRPFDIIVAGHTDNVPIKTAQFPSNWYLSVQRATNFLTAMLLDSNLDPSHFSTRGYGELHPIAPNDTPEGKQKNRRVELLISQPMVQEVPQ